MKMALDEFKSIGDEIFALFVQFWINGGGRGWIFQKGKTTYRNKKNDVLFLLDTCWLNDTQRNNTKTFDSPFSSL